MKRAVSEFLVMYWPQAVMLLTALLTLTIARWWWYSTDDEWRDF